MIRLEPLVLVILLWGASAHAQGVVSFYPASYSDRVVVSRDGSLVGGAISAEGADGFLLDEFGQITDLPQRVTAISGDGSVVSMHGGQLLIDGVSEPLPGAGPGFSAMRVMDISADGNTLGGVIGQDPLIVRAAIFDRTTNAYTILEPVVPLGDFEIPIQFSTIEGMSSDGSTLVGMASDLFQPGMYDAVRISAAGVVTYLETIDPANGVTFSFATSASEDGSVIAGVRTWPATGFWEAWRWEDGVVTGLGIQSRAASVTANGYRVVGSFCPETPCAGWRFESALYWTADTGPRELAEVLTDDFGVDLGGWRLIAVSDVSDLGLVLVGTAEDPNGQLGYFVARLPQAIEVQLPEPGFGAGLTIGALAAASFRRRTRRSSR